jgi:hypothetical protein
MPLLLQQQDRAGQGQSSRRCDPSFARHHDAVHPGCQATHGQTLCLTTTYRAKPKRCRIPRLAACISKMVNRTKTGTFSRNGTRIALKLLWCFCAADPSSCAGKPPPSPSLHPSPCRRLPLRRVPLTGPCAPRESLRPPRGGPSPRRSGTPVRPPLQSPICKRHTRDHPLPRRAGRLPSPLRSPTWPRPCPSPRCMCTTTARYI